LSSQHLTAPEHVARTASPHHDAPANAGPLSHIHEHPEIESTDLAEVRRLLRTPGRVLDVGAGRGGFVLLARGGGVEACALDLEPSAAPIWRQRGVPGVLADAFNPPFRDGAFAVVRLKEIIEHVEDPRALVVTARALLRPGGCILAHVPSPYSQFYPVGNFWDDYTHVRPFSRLALQRLFEDSGMILVSIAGYTAGRNAIERALGKLVASFLPHTYRVVARRAP
jgi:SAM-dependent methyltransferase